MTIQIILELIAILLIGYGILKEDQLIAIETELIEILKWCIKNPDVVKRNIERNLSK